MTILVAGWDPEWVENIRELLCKRFASLLVTTLHHKGSEEKTRPLVPWFVRHGGKQKVLGENILHISLARGVAWHLYGSSVIRVFVLSTDFGFRSVAECVSEIRLLPQYRFTPTIIHASGVARDLAEVERLGIAGVMTGYDISPIVSVLNSLETESEVRP